MMFLGKVLQIDEREQYFKTAVAVETGYNTDIYVLRIPFNKMIDGLTVGHKILFTGQRRKRGDVEKFHLESIRRQDYSSCLELSYVLSDMIKKHKSFMEPGKLCTRCSLLHTSRCFSYKEVTLCLPQYHNPNNGFTKSLNNWRKVIQLKLRAGAIKQRLR